MWKKWLTFGSNDAAVVVVVVVANFNRMRVSSCSFQVRATPLRDKQSSKNDGQAGVVTVVFDNTNPDDYCPVGYEANKKITVSRQVCGGNGGKNKYSINGKPVPDKNVADLFRSIQMNVNNPNFLIMQGHITKVLNMKPIEVSQMNMCAFRNGPYVNPFCSNLDLDIVND